MIDIQEKLQQGIAAAEAGHKVEARTLLTQVVEADNTQLEAWWWLSRLVDSLENKIICLENVLALDPEHETAPAELAQVKAEQAALFAPAYLVEDSPPPTPEPLLASLTPTAAEFDDEWLCPYCTAPTVPTAKSCPQCRRSLVMIERVQAERSPWLWRGLLLQFVVAFYLLVFGAGYLTLIVKWHGIADPIPFLPLYFGLPVDQPEALTQTVLALFPPLVFWGLLGAALYSLGLLVLLYIRVPYGNVLYLINASLTFISGLLGMLFFYHTILILIASMIGLLVGLVQFVITLNLWHDFTFKATRLRLKVDSGVKNHPTFYLSGRKYSQLGMWGLAIIHLRRAVVRDPGNVAYRIALAKAYLNIKRYDLAQQEFREAQTLQPNAPEVIQLGARLAGLKRNGSE